MNNNINNITNNNINNIINNDISNLKFIDLFCGIGGFHQALNKLNCKCVMACDIDKNCRKVYETNYNIKPHEDITKINEKEIPNFDILTAGFPCFVAGTQVLTKYGYKNIEDVSSIDKLLTHKNNFNNILNLQRKVYNGILYKIKIKNHINTIKCTSEHPFYVIRKKNDCNDSINNGINNGINNSYKYNYSNYYSNPSWVYACDLNENHYIGMVINNNSLIPQMKFNNEYIDFTDTNLWFNMGYFIGHNYTLWDINDYYKIWFTYVFSLNNDTKHIPEWVQDAPIIYIKEFIKGLKYNNSSTNGKYLYKYNIDSYNIASSIQRLYLKIDIIISFRIVDNILYILEQINELNNSDEAFIKYNTQTSTKYAWYLIQGIKSENVINVGVYNFEVEKDNSYIVENAVVHNCQSYSNAGLKGGLEDKRGQLFSHIMRIAKHNKPKFMFLENVKHIKKIDNGNAFKYILKTIDENGYYVHENDSVFEISPHQLGVPQQRERVIFVCIRKDIYNKDIKLNPLSTENLGTLDTQINFSNFFITNNEYTNNYKISSELISLFDAYNELINIFDVNTILSPTLLINDYFKNYTNNELKNLPKWKQDYIPKNKLLLDKYKPQVEEWYNKHKNLLTKKEIYGKLEWQAGKKKENDSIYNYFIQMRQSGIRVKAAKYFPTLVAIVQTPIYGKEKRYITPRECARLQSFPDDFIMHENDKIAYKQFGNAVNVDVVHLVIKDTLNKYIK